MSLGPFDLGEANDSNKYGHFEAQPFVHLNRELQLWQFGFEGDLPDDAQAFRRYCDADGCWTREATISDETIARGRKLIGQLMQSGSVCGFKDPRTVLVWPFWQRVFASLSGLRVVPLFLIRGPHEIAMSIFRRSQGDRDYAQALDVVAVHFRRMKEIADQWRGPSAIVRFCPESYGFQARQTAELCDLAWSDSALSDVYDASCRHHETTPIDHPAQAAFEALAGLPPSRLEATDRDRLLIDTSIREATLQRTRAAYRQDRDAARQTVALLEQENAALRQTAARVSALEARLAHTTHSLELIQNSRTWRSRQAVVDMLRFRRHGPRSDHRAGIPR
jgi:hypothetical protein